MQVTNNINEQKLYNQAFALALFTIVYNVAEGIISTYFGYEDEALTLFGFGVDSFIEMISGIGIAHMILRMRRNPQSKRDDFEHLALRITGYSFYLLVAGLILSSVVVIYTGQKPSTTVLGVVISLLSVAVMWVLIRAKIQIGTALNSAPILADANCTKVCIYMSIILLISSGLYELTNLPYLDALGTLGLAWFSYKEGKECFEKAANQDGTCSCHHS